jgi:hypothetical protein
VHQAKPIAASRQRSTLHRRDFYAWLLEQAHVLRKLDGSIPHLDCLELAEEIEGMARSDERALESNLENLLVHLLKWTYQAHRQTRSWRATISNARSDVQNLLQDSPSLGSKLPLLVTRAYEKARRSAGAEMELDEREWSKRAPTTCPWNLELLLNDFWPESINLNSD